MRESDMGRVEKKEKRDAKQREERIEGRGKKSKHYKVKEL